MEPTIIDQLYQSEINFRIETFWDGGFTVKLGDRLNGFVDETNVENWAQVVDWLKHAAVRHFPKSLFAYRHGPLHYAS